MFRRDPSQLQLGSGPGTGLLLSDRPGLVDLLRLLDGDRDTATIACLARERIPDLADSPEQLIDALRAAGVIVDAAAWDDIDPPLRGEARSLAAGGVESGLARDRLLGRGQTRVEIRTDDAAEPLATATAERLGELGIETTHSRSAQVAVVLVIAQGAAARDTFTALRYERVPHLAVGIDGPVVHIGPFVHPYVTPCVECIDRARAEWDPSWPAIVPQLGTPLVRVEASCLSTTTQATAAALIAGEVMTFCDELEPLTAAQSIALGPGVHDRIENGLDFHPDCACRT